MGGNFQNYKGAWVAIATKPPGPVRPCKQIHYLLSVPCLSRDEIFMDRT